MASKLGTILSLLFVSLTLAILGDLGAIQIIHSDLDALALTVGYQISSNGLITESLKGFVNKDGKTTLVSLTQGPVALGGTIEFALSRVYHPLIVRKEDMAITVKRSAVIGYII